MNEELQNILKKVRELYMKYGIRSITMDDISSELGISKKTLYQHVADKDELVGKFIENEISIRHHQICECISKNCNAIEELVDITLFMNKMMKEQNPATEHDLKKYYPHHFQKTVKARREGIYKYILVNLKKGKAEGLYREDLNEDIIAKMHLSRIEATHQSGIFTPEEVISVKLFMELLVYHVRGIATAEGIAVLDKKVRELEEKERQTNTNI